MTQPLLRPPTTLQPRPKANPTFSSSSIDTRITLKTPQQSRNSSETRESRPSRSSPSHSESDQVVAAFIRRVLCSQNSTAANGAQSIDEVLPPLTSSNEVDLQLYATIAIVVKELVYSWYGKITPDQTFVEEVVQIIAHCTRALEGRLRRVDLEALILDEIPELIESHILAYRTSHDTARTIQSPISARTIYHNLIPHPALSPVPDHGTELSVNQQSKNEADYRQLLVQGALAVLLPTEDLENVCLRTLVADVVAETIIGNTIGGRVCEGCFIWTSVTRLAEAVKASMTARATGEEIEVDTRSRLEKFGLLSERGQDQRAAMNGTRSTFSEVFWRLLQYSYLAIISIRFVIVGMFAASAETPRSSSKWKATADSPIAKGSEAPAATLRPMLEFSIFSFCSTILDLSFRMPWLSGSLALLQHHLIRSPLYLLRVGAVDGLLDQYLHHLLTTQLLYRNPSLFPALLRTLRTTLFPRFGLNNNKPQPSLSPPGVDGSAENIKNHCAETLSSLLPTTITKAMGMTDEEIVREISGELSVWEDEYMNKHLAYRILELVIVRLLPEMGEKGVGELMAVRGLDV